MTKEPRIYSVGRTVSSVKIVGKTGWPHALKKKEKVKLDHYHTHKMTEWAKDSQGTGG